MARIKDYDIDTTLSADDKILGTDVNGNLTKNFTLEDIKEYVASGVDVVLPVPPRHFPVINEEGDNVQVSGLSQTLTQLSVDIGFYPALNNQRGTHDNHNVGSFEVVANGSNWILQIKNYTGRYNLLSFIGKTMEGEFGSSSTFLKFSIDSIMQDGDKDWFIDSDGNQFFKFYITPDDADQFSGLTDSISIFTEAFVRAGDNANGTLELVSINVGSDIELSNANIDQLTVNNIDFDISGSDNEGITFGSAPNYHALELDSSDNLSLTGYGTSTFTIDTPTTTTKTWTASGDVTLNNVTVNGTADFNDGLNIDDDSLVVKYTLASDDRQVEVTQNGITRTFSDDSTQDITYVIANQLFEEPRPNSTPLAPTDGGVLHRLQIGNDYFNIPAATSSVASVLPGLSEILAPVPGAGHEAIRQEQIGGINSTTIDNDDTTSVATWIGANGNFAFYRTTASFDISNSGNFTTDSSSDLTPITTHTQITTGTPNHLIVYADDANKVPLGKLTTGDYIRIYPSGSTDDQYFQFTISSVAHYTVGSDTLFLFHSHDAVTSAGTDFDLATGVNYDLEGINNQTGNITTGDWFYGVDHGTYVEYKSTITGTVTGINLSAGDTSATIAQNTVIRDAYTAIPNGQRLFFLGTSLPDSIADGDIVGGNAYEVVGFEYDNGDSPAMSYLEFSLIGQGNLLISTPDITFANLTVDNVTENFLVLDNDNKLHTKELSDVAGFTSVVNYVSTSNSANNGAVASITFEDGPGDHLISLNAGALSVDVTGRIGFSDGVQATDFTAEAWTTYILDVTSATRTVTLPASDNLTAGDTIRLLNLSDIDSDGDPLDPAFFWEVAPATGDRIMKLPTTETLVLNDANSIDLIWSGSASIGWIIK